MAATPAPVADHERQAGSMTAIITKPGVYEMPEDDYHADPVPDWSLSASGAKLLLDPHCPAQYRWVRDNPRPRTKALDTGTIAHGMVLGSGVQAVQYPEGVLAKNGAASTNDAKAFKEQAAAAGQIALKADEYREVVAMVDALRAHPIAGKIFNPERGKPERSLFWHDRPNEIWRRARLDWLPNPDNSGRLIVADYKTARSANPRTWLREACNLGYHLQDANYRAGVAAVTGTPIRDIAFVFVVQEKEPPYCPVVIELNPEAQRAGAELMDRAARTFRHCLATNTWPGYADDRIVDGQLPGWYLNQIDEEY